VWFGTPEDDRRTPCLSEEKWAEYFSFTMLYLGFYIDTRLMIMAWPVDKRLALAVMIDNFLVQLQLLQWESSTPYGFNTL
jgi:hypothetical protein